MYANFAMVVSNINGITTETIDEEIANKDLDNLILNAIKSLRNIKKIKKKLLPNSEINEKNISNQLEYLTNNNTLKNKPNDGKDSYFIVNETDQNMPDIFPEQILCPVNFKTPSVKLKLPSSVPYEEKCSTVTSSSDGTEINKYQEKIKNLTIELTALPLFIKEQFYIIKKQLENMVNTQKPANKKSISSLQEEIDYLREENHAKTQRIKHLTDMKVVLSNSNITTGACSCKLASTHTYCVDSNYKEPSIDLKTNTKSKSKKKIR